MSFTGKSSSSSRILKSSGLIKSHMTCITQDNAASPCKERQFDVKSENNPNWNPSASPQGMTREHTWAQWSEGSGFQLQPKDIWNRLCKHMYREGKGEANSFPCTDHSPQGFTNTRYLWFTSQWCGQLHANTPLLKCLLPSVYFMHSLTFPWNLSSLFFNLLPDSGFAWGSVWGLFLILSPRTPVISSMTPYSNPALSSWPTEATVRSTYLSQRCPLV